MKLLTLTLTLIFIFNCSLTAQGGPNGGPNGGSTSPTAGTGTGILEVEVVYPQLGVFYNPSDQPPIGSQGGGSMGVSSGEIGLGTYFPPSLNEANINVNGIMYKEHNGWDNWFIPFYISGAKGINFSYSISEPIRISGEEGIILSDANLKGSTTPDGWFQPIPRSGSPQIAKFSDDTGMYYIRMHFSSFLIRYGCPAGQRTFETTLTCSYN